LQKLGIEDLWNTDSQLSSEETTKLKEKSFKNGPP